MQNQEDKFSRGCSACGAKVILIGFYGLLFLLLVMIIFEFCGWLPEKQPLIGLILFIYIIVIVLLPPSWIEVLLGILITDYKGDTGEEE